MTSSHQGNTAAQDTRQTGIQQNPLVKGVQDFELSINQRSEVLL